MYAPLINLSFTVAAGLCIAASTGDGWLGCATSLAIYVLSPYHPRAGK